jgi:hypothetical protein
LTRFAGSKAGSNEREARSKKLEDFDRINRIGRINRI